MMDMQRSTYCVSAMLQNLLNYVDHALHTDVADVASSALSVAWGAITGKPTTFTPSAHAASHQNGGTDEISVAGLTGLLADDQNPVIHHDDHENGGLDEIDVTGLSGVLADEQDPVDHASDHENGGGDEISIAGLSGEAADPQPAKINGLAADTPVDADEFIFYDSSGSHNNKVTGANLKTYIGGGAANVSPIVISPLSTPITVWTGGTWARYADSDYILGGYLSNSPAVDGNGFSMPFRCPAGTYTLYVHGLPSTNRGKVDVSIDASAIATEDWYGATDYTGVIKEHAGIVLSEGAHTLYFLVNGKNPSSSGYRFSVQMITLVRTA